MSNDTSVINVLHAAALDKSYAAHFEKEASLQLSRPFFLLRPKLYIDGNKWCALYGDNIQDGVAGFGTSPENAALGFDKEWIKEIDRNT